MAPRTLSLPGKTRARKTKPAPASLLAQLGIVGLEPVEPVILAAVISGDTLLLIGPHGTGKSYMLVRLCAALELTHRHYNASLLNYDDLVGYPLPDGRGGLDYVRTPASIWDAEAVFIDEISRCRPDMQNKLFPIIHERRVQGILLDRLVHRWSAMNPPAAEDDLDTPYRGSEPLDTALADRFAFVVPIPAWDGFTEEQQKQVILAGESDPCPEAARSLRNIVAKGRALLPSLRSETAPQLASYVRCAVSLLQQAGIDASPRRAGTILRNILAVHAARLARGADADIAGSAWLALSHSLPFPALGLKAEPVKILAAHREAWNLAGLTDDDPRRIIHLEKDPLERALRASALPTVGAAEYSTIVADAVAALPAGARHALAAALFESGHAGRLLAAVAEQCAELYALAATPQDVNESVTARSTRHDLWQKLVRLLAKLNPDHRDTPYLTNLLTGLFGKGDLQTPADLENVGREWKAARRRIREVLP